MGLLDFMYSCHCWTLDEADDRFCLRLNPGEPGLALLSLSRYILELMPYLSRSLGIVATMGRFRPKLYVC